MVSDDAIEEARKMTEHRTRMAQPDFENGQKVRHRASGQEGVVTGYSLERDAYGMDRHRKTYVIEYGFNQEAVVEDYLIEAVEE